MRRRFSSSLLLASAVCALASPSAYAQRCARAGGTGNLPLTFPTSLTSTLSGDTISPLLGQTYSQQLQQVRAQQLTQQMLSSQRQYAAEQDQAAREREAARERKLAARKERRDTELAERKARQARLRDQFESRNLAAQ